MTLSEQVSFAPAQGRRVLIALSGGADSVALLHLAIDAAKTCDMHLFAAHFDHRIRGAESDGDRSFCASLCERLHVPLFIGSADIPRIASETGRGTETVAREERYRFLYDTADRCGAELVLTAHHANDQAETVLMHLFRGSGTDGLAGMSVRSGRLFRPLLHVRSRALREYLVSIGEAWREDSTNMIADTPRNALRLNVLPEIERIYPGATDAIVRCARITRAENDFLSRVTDEYLAAHTESGPYGQKLRTDALPDEAILRRALKKICGSEIGSARIDALADMCRQARGRTDIDRDRYAVKTPTGLYILKRDPAIPKPVDLRIPGDTRFGEYSIRAELGTFPIERDDPHTELFDADVLRGACVRTRQAGDRFRPLGAPGDAPLSDFFTNRKIDQPLRDFLPLIAKGARVFWVAGIAPAEETKITSLTRRTLRLEIRKTDGGF